MGTFTWVIIYLALCVILGFASWEVSASKGYEGGFSWGFWLGFVGLFVVGFKPVVKYPPLVESVTTLYKDGILTRDEYKRKLKHAENLSKIEKLAQLHANQPHFH